MNAMPPDAIQSLRSRLYEAGYRPVPIYSPDHAVDCAGKRPLGNAWQVEARREPPFCVVNPSVPHAGNTGVLCDGLRAIDVDIDDRAIAGTVKALAIELFGEAPLRWRANSGRVLLVYRAADGEPGKRSITGTAGKVEFLGRGQQFVGFGTHPSGAALRWQGSLLDTPRDKLPAVTEDAISGFLTAAAPMIGAEVPKAEPDYQGDHGASSFGPTADPLDIATALACIPNNGSADWEWFNRIGMATWHASGGSSAGYAAWCAWSERHPSHDAAVCVERWRHYRTSPPGSIGAGTLFHLAKEARVDWRKPTDAAPAADGDRTEGWGEPDMTVLRLRRRTPPSLPLDLFGPHWSAWIARTAEAGATAPDYVACNLLAAVSGLIGNARWPQATPGWREPPHLWIGAVGDSGTNKSSGADALMRDVLPAIEARMMGDFPDRLKEWKAKAEAAKAAIENWQKDVRKAVEGGYAPPHAPAEAEPEPQAPRLRQNDVTVERVATLLAYAAPKGLLVTRDELAGWLLGLTAYNDAGRAFWIEAFGGRPYRVERQKSPEPIIVPRLAVAVSGSTQPEKLAEMFAGADDGLMGRFIWAWPEPPPFRLSRTTPGIEWAIEALDRLRMLDLAPDDRGEMKPINVPLVEPAVDMMERFGQDMQREQQEAGGLLRSAFGKARGIALRLSIGLEYLWWCGQDGMAPPPASISETALAAAIDLVADYFMPMAARVYGDAAATTAERTATTLARWIVKAKPDEVHVRTLQRTTRLPGLNTADLIHDAAAVLVEAGWL